MINLLPPAVREERRFGRLNKFMLKQLVALVIIGILGVLFMLSGLQLIVKDETKANEDLADKKLEYSKLSSVEKEAKDANSTLNSLTNLYQSEIKFSELLVDIASAIPTSSRLTSLSVDETIENPLQLIFRASSQSEVAVLRASLVESEIFVAADILSITAGTLGEDGSTGEVSTTISAKIADGKYGKSTVKSTTSNPDTSQNEDGSSR